MYWQVKNYGRLCLRADNAGLGFDLPAAGAALEINLNLELVRTAIHDLQRRQPFYEEYITDENIPALIAALDDVGNVDDRLHDALQLRDRLELKAAQNSIDSVRKGTLQVTARDVNSHPVPGCTVTIDQTAHDFLFGANGGTMADPPEALWQKIKDAGFELAPSLPAWGFTESGPTDVPPNTYWGHDAIDGVFGMSRILDYGLKLKFTGTVWMQGSASLGILPARTSSMTWEQIQAANIAHQDLLLNDFKNDPVIWEVMNEPATTNTVGMPRLEMAEMMNTSALHIKAANANLQTLVNSPSEFDFGFRYQSYKLDGATAPTDNADANGYNTTYSDFLKQARASIGNLDSIDIIGLQFYPGAHVSSTFTPPGENPGEAPAFTPSWLVDTANRYNTEFGKPVHITELSFPSSYNVGTTWHSGYWREQWTEMTQADYAESVYTMMFADPSVHSVLWWDTPDTGAFVESGGLVRSDLSEKPSYQRIKALIASWTTHDEAGATNGSGQATLSGFGGDYNVTVEGPDGHTENRTAHIDERDQNTLVVNGFTAVPQTTGLSPNHKTAGDPGFTLTVNGTDFVAGSKVHWKGSERETTYVSGTQLNAAIPASDITSNGTASVTVINPSGESNPQTFTIGTVTEPTTTGLSPDHKTVGDAQFTLTVNGTNFVTGSVVRWNGVDRATTFGSDTQLTATIPASDLMSAGTASVTVFNPAPGGGTSNAQTFTINNPAPTTTGLSPDHKTVGDAQFTLTVNGTNFVSTSTVRWNGVARPTSYVSGTQLTATIPASDLATAGTANVTVNNTTPGGGTSGAQTFTINNPAPTTTGIDPMSKNIGDPLFALTVYGTNFVNGSTVRWNGENKITTYVSATQLTATIMTTDLAAVGAATVTVFNGAPGGGESGPQTFTISESPLPPPSVGGITPATSTNAGSVHVTIAGDGFINGATARLSRAGVPGIVATNVQFVSPASLTCDLNLKNAAPGAYTVTVTNPDTKSSELADCFTITQAPPPQPPTESTTPTWYLAEGTSDYGFDTYINIENPNNAVVTALVTYMTKSGPKTRAALMLPPRSQTTINPRNDLGPMDFSTKVECKEGKTICVDRRMIWTGAGAASPEGTSSVGITSPAKTWYLAEGSSKWGFETWLLIQNPNASAAKCIVTYMTEDQGPRQVTKTVPGGSRASFNMETDIGQRDASIKVEADRPVIPERAMYRNNRREGHDSIGTTTPAKDFYLAEGTTGYGFTTYVLVQNPNAKDNSVSVTCMTPEGPVTLPAMTVPANSRRTMRLNDALPGKDLSTHVKGSLPLIAERAMYWGAGGALGEACHDSIGMDSPHTTFYLPDGETQSGYETWTLVQNPNAVDVAIEVSYLAPSGKGNVVFTDVVKAQSRKTYNMGDKIPAGKAAIVVTSKTAGKKIMVERAMYWNSRGAGTDTIGGYAD